MDTELFIVAYKDQQLTQKAINSFRETALDSKMKVTVMDNSPEKLVLKNVDAHYHYPFNPSLTRVWNWSIAMSKSPWTIISNSDVEFIKGWHERWESEGFKKQAYVHNWFYCFFIHKEAVKQIGWFDERFTEGYWEDMDYVRRLKGNRMNWNADAFQDVIKHHHDFSAEHYPKASSEKWYERKWGDLKPINEVTEVDGPYAPDFNWYPRADLSYV